MARADVIPGSVWLAELGGGIGREQHGRRPVVVLSSNWHLLAVDHLVMIVPCTSRDRGWANHVEITTPPLTTRTFAMTEQLRTISRDRLIRPLAMVDESRMAEIRRWVNDWIDGQR